MIKKSTDKPTQAWDKEENKEINMLLCNVHHILVKPLLFISFKPCFISIHDLEPVLFISSV